VQAASDSSDKFSVLLDRVRDKIVRTTHQLLNCTCLETNRLRVDIAEVIYSWTGSREVSRSVEEILQWGPTGTGAFGAHLIDIFSNPSVRFRALGEKEQVLEYGLRVPSEASPLIVRAGTEWRQAGYSGSLNIDRSSLEIRRFTMELTNCHQKH
jgi:hypothetical protein